MFSWYLAGFFEKCIFSVLKNQGLFDQALDVLDHLEKKGENTESINIEREIIQTLIKKSNKD